jgi:hypothetical protein
MASSQAMNGLVEGLRLAAARIGLPAWFIAVDLLWVAKPEVLGVDARHYQRAAAAWLSGADPWLVTENGVGFAPGPHTLLYYAPTSLLPLWLSEVSWLVAGFAASLWLLRRLGVPLWWVLFPPLAHSIWNANPQTVVLALLVAGGTVPAVLAVGLKLYAGLALFTRPKDLVITGIVLAIVLPILPWRLYLQDAGIIASYLVGSWDGSAWRFPILIPPTLLGLWVLRRNGAEWLAVPAIWPSTQFYYVAMALPMVVKRPALAALFALPAPLIVPLTTIGLAGWHLWVRWQVSHGRPDPVVRAPLWLRRLVGPVG